MGSSREDSPDWLRCFQAPTLTLSSDSDSFRIDGPLRDDKIDSQSPEPDNDHDPVPGESGAESKPRVSERGTTADEIPAKNMQKMKKKKKKKKEIQGDGSHGQVAVEATSEKLIEAANCKVWTLSSDSESSPDNNSRRETKNSQLKKSGKDKVAVLVRKSEGSPLKKTLKEKSPRKQLDGGHTMKKEKNKNDDLPETGDNDDVEVEVAEDTSEKHITPHVAASRVPLLLSDKVNRSKALVECDGESIDLSGDVGAVGRIVIQNTSSGNNEMFFDLKGTIYKTTIIPSRTFCVVSFGQSEAKIEAIMNDFIQLKAHSNVYEGETMVEGTLEGFSFESEDEAEKMPKAVSRKNDQKEVNEEQSNGKNKRKAKESSVAAQKKGKSGGKPQPAKRATKKAQVSKKAKTKK